MLQIIQDEVVACRRCPRLVEWRERIGAERRAAFRDQSYWARPVPAWGDPDASLMILGLAPAAHGANRTGRMFTGDRSGDFLYAALHRAGLASSPLSAHRDDGLTLRGIWITAAVRCAPPANQPTPDERDACQGWLLRELDALPSLRAVLCLGAFGWEAALRALRARGAAIPSPAPRFGHEAEARVGGLTLVGSFHPSQQNTFTRKLTVPMFDAIFARARELA
jgi:uracil-DNA glycosylase family 4